MPDEILTYFNPLGPIAKVERQSTAAEKQFDSKRIVPKATYDKIQEIYGQAHDFNEGYHKITDILSRNPRTQTPFDNTGKVFREYMDNIKDINVLTMNFQRSLNGALDLSLDRIQAGDDDFDRQMQHFAEELTDAAENIDPNNLDAYLRKIKSITKQMANLLANQPNADAYTRELARLLGSILDTNDPAAMGEKMERLIQLLDRFQKSNE